MTLQLRDEEAQHETETVAYVATAIVFVFFFFFFFIVSLPVVGVWFMLRSRRPRPQHMAPLPQHKAPKPFLLPHFIRRDHAAPRATVDSTGYPLHGPQSGSTP